MNKNEIRGYAFEAKDTGTMRVGPVGHGGGSGYNGEAPKLAQVSVGKQSKQQAEYEAALRKQQIEERARYASQVDLQLQTMGGSVVVMLAGLAQTIYQWDAYQGFWDQPNTGEKIALMHTELSEALEADRKQLTSDHIPEFSGVEEELADCIARILAYAGHHELRVGEALIAKLRYNLTRPYKHNKQY